MKKVLLTTALSLMMCIGIYAQDYMNAPKRGEKVLGTISIEKAAWLDWPVNDNNQDHRYNYSTKLRWYETLLEKAKQEYPGKTIDIRNMEVGNSFISTKYGGTYLGPAVGKVICMINPEIQTKESLSQAINKALRNVREGSRMAIDQITVTSSMDRENLKDQLIDVLLEKGYRVVAKEYLQKLYEEQKDQESGLYNPDTKVEGSKFSAVGYFINVKGTETYLRVQIVNVSTGEYEGNATVNF